MTAYQAVTLVTRVAVATALAALAVIMAVHQIVTPPLVNPPYCEGKPDVGFCYLDLSDGREYVIYTDPATGRLGWYEQNWRDGSP